MNLSTYSDSSRVLAKNTCECGRRKRQSVEACDRCRFLDGRTNVGRRTSPAEIISVLRGTDGLSLREICDALGLDTSTKNGQRGIYRLAKSMLESGRVRRYWRETEPHIVEQSPTRRKWGARGGSGCWVYILDGAGQ